MLLLMNCLKELKERTDSKFEDACETGLFTIKILLLDHLCQDLDKFGSV